MIGSMVLLGKAPTTSSLPDSLDLVGDMVASTGSGMNGVRAMVDSTGLG